MINILVIDISGSVNETKVKNLTYDTIYKKCGYESSSKFNCQAKWSIDNGEIQLWGKIDGNPGTENKYDFPPPVDNILLFGKCALVNVDKEKFIHLTEELWNKTYEKLFGGFEDLLETEKDDENEMDELDNIDNKFKTKAGYLKDGFVVDTSEEDDEYNDEDEEFEDEEFEDDDTSYATTHDSDESESSESNSSELEEPFIY